MNIWQRFLQLINNNKSSSFHSHDKSNQQKQDNQNNNIISNESLAEIYAKETLNNTALSALFVNILQIQGVLKQEKFNIYPSIKYNELIEFKGDLFSLYLFPVIYKYDIMLANKYRILKHIAKNINQGSDEITQLIMNTSYTEYISIKPHSNTDNTCTIELKCNLYLSDSLSKYDLSRYDIKDFVNVNIRHNLKNIDIISISQNEYHNKDKSLTQKVYQIEALLEYDDTSVYKLYNYIVNKQGDIKDIIHSGLKKIYSQFYLNTISVFTHIDKEINIMKKDTIEGHVLRAICFIPDIILYHPKLEGKNDDIIKTNDLLSRLYSDIFGLDDNSLNDINYNELLKTYK